MISFCIILTDIFESIDIPVLPHRIQLKCYPHKRDIVFLFRCISTVFNLINNLITQRNESVNVSSCPIAGL